MWFSRMNYPAVLATICGVLLFSKMNASQVPVTPELTKPADLAQPTPGKESITQPSVLPAVAQPAPQSQLPAAVSISPTAQPQAAATGQGIPVPEKPVAPQFTAPAEMPNGQSTKAEGQTKTPTDAAGNVTSPLVAPQETENLMIQDAMIQPQQANPTSSSSAVTSQASVPTQEKIAAIPRAPSPVADKTPQEESLGQEGNIIGIDTIELQEAQGNWLFKRLWWERAEEKYEKIRKQVASIMESRGQFFEKRNAAEKNIFDNVYQQIGFERGELEELINRLMERMNKLREREGVLDEKEREFYAQLQTEKKALDTLKANVTSITVLENSIDDVLAKLMETINRVREYEQESWQNFKDIARVLDDRKAKEMFYKIDAIWRNVTSLKEYIQTRLSAHFDQLLTKAKEETDRISKNVQDLKDKGLDLQKQEEAILQYDRDKEAARIRALEQEQEESSQDEEQEEGFFTSYIWNPIKAVVTWPYYAIFGGGQEDEQQQEEQVNAEPMPAKQGAAVAQQSAQPSDVSNATEKSGSPESQPADTVETQEGFFTTYVLNPLKSVWHLFVSIITWPYYALVGNSHENDQDEVEQPQQAAVTEPSHAAKSSPSSGSEQESQDYKASLAPSEGKVAEMAQPNTDVEKPTLEIIPAVTDQQQSTAEQEIVTSQSQDKVLPANTELTADTENLSAPLPATGVAQ